MASTSISLQRLNIEAEKTAAGAAAAKELVRSAKAELKKVRKLSKTAKKAAKLARKKVEAAKLASVAVDSARPAKSLKSPKAKSSALRPALTPRKPRVKGEQSASQVAKAVITRMSAVRRPAAVAGTAVETSAPATLASHESGSDS